MTFFPHIDSKKVCTLIKDSVTKFSVISSVQYTLSFITSSFEEMFSQSRNFYENNMMVLSDPAKSAPESADACIDGYDSQNKDKNITITKIRVCYFSVQCTIAKNM